MSATKLEIHWNESSSSDHRRSSQSGHFRGVLRTISLQQAELRCPKCDSIVYSRRHRLCGTCCQPLPEEYLFSPYEAQRIQRMLERERERYRAWIKKASSV